MSQGISLNIEQYQAFLKAIPEINASLKELGVDVSGSGVDGDEDEEEVNPRKKAAAKKESKANIDATSDEEE